MYRSIASEFQDCSRQIAALDVAVCNIRLKNVLPNVPTFPKDSVLLRDAAALREAFAEGQAHFERDLASLAPSQLLALRRAANIKP